MAGLDGNVGAGMDERQHEYDRFGPWAIEVTTADPAPPLFRPHLTRSDPALLSIKIPRHIERRNARPGMDLYDYLVCLYEDDLTVMQRVGHEVRTETVRYQDVQYLRVSQDLLRGCLHLGLPSRPFELPYNTVSEALMERAVDLVRARYAGTDAHVATSAVVETGRARRRSPRLAARLQLRRVQRSDPEEGVLSFYFDRLLADERRHSPSLRLLAAQGTLAVADGGVHPLRRILFSIASKRLLESLHLTDGRELKIIDRGATYAYRWQAVYGVRTTFMPLVNLREATWRDDAAHATTVLELRTSGGTVEQVFSRDNPSMESYASYLSALRAGAKGRAKDDPAA